MPLYFFDSRDNDESIEDDIGLEYPDIDAVKVEAAHALAELARDVIPGSVKRELAIEVRDELGPVLRAPMRFRSDYAARALMRAGQRTLPLQFISGSPHSSLH